MNKSTNTGKKCHNNVAIVRIYSVRKMFCTVI